MKKIALLSLGLLITAQVVHTYAQDRKEPLVRDGIYERETIPQRVPIPYPYLRETDILWEKRIWRIIDLGEKLNHPLYYPTVKMHDRVSLVQRLMDAIKYNEISAYSIEDDEFTSLKSYNQILADLDAVDEERVIRNPLTGLDTTIIVPGSIPWHQIKQLLIKEVWYFDRQHSTMHVRLLGICPIRVYVRTLDTGDEDLDIGGEVSRVQLFWVYYPHARSVLANTSVFNTFNDAQRISFDDLIFKRKFSSYIIQESNVYDNRRIPEYTFGGISNMLESERIKNDIFILEHDLWEW